MRKTMVIMFLLVISSVKFSYTYISPHDRAFQYLDESHFNVLTNLLTSSDKDIIYSAIKRIGELRLEQALIPVRDWLKETDPKNIISEMERAELRNIFQISIWTIGIIGEDADIEYLSKLFREMPIEDIETKFYIIEAFGEANQNDMAVERLNEFSYIVKDTRLVESLVSAILNQNSKSSYEPLFDLSQRSIFSEETKNWLFEAAIQVLTEGR